MPQSWADVAESWADVAESWADVAESWADVAESWADVAESWADVAESWGRCGRVLGPMRPSGRHGSELLGLVSELMGIIPDPISPVVHPEALPFLPRPPLAPGQTRLALP